MLEESDIFTKDSGDDNDDDLFCDFENLFSFSSPACQCNGHSNCSVNSSTCISCKDYTSGEQSCISKV